MSRARYLGDEAHAAAWRLAGIDTRIVADPAKAAAAFAEARQAADLVLLAQAHEQTLTAMDRRALAPLLLTLPDAATREQPSELAQRVRKLLGMDT
jgi:vacuolar-type H+-ATPase subunit F/Vma7